MYILPIGAVFQFCAVVFRNNTADGCGREIRLSRLGLPCAYLASIHLEAGAGGKDRRSIRLPS